eukprot:TRINITY_DN9510_c0_g3_i6.p1 TRINITY_DN9510_c0_g3~~TRINITY_DN9510_c0_g3_i6.p1  ORF type:complete len:101 (-),score=9.46 TRINITY_DN9510_c0_g3_i6:277-558(-)
MIRRPPRSTHCISSAASDVYKRQLLYMSLIVTVFGSSFFSGTGSSDSSSDSSLFTSSFCFSSFFFAFSSCINFVSLTSDLSSLLLLSTLMHGT